MFSTSVVAMYITIPYKIIAKAKKHLCILRFVSKSNHPNVLRLSLEESRLRIIWAARFCNRCKLLLDAADSSRNEVSV